MLIRRRTALMGAATFGVGAAVATRARAQTSGAPIKFGHIVATSGPLKSVSEPSIVAADMAVADINAHGGVNGHPLSLVRYDTGSDPRQAAIAARKLIEDDQVLAIVGPFSSGEVAVAMNDAERAQTTMVPVAASRPGLIEGKKFLFRLVPDEAVGFRNVLRSLQKDNSMPKTTEILYVSDEAVSNESGTKSMPAILAEFGVKFGAPVAFQYKTFDVAPQVAKALESKPDIITLASLPEPAARAIKELRRQGYTGRVIGSQLYGDPNNVELFGKDGDGVIFASSFWKGMSPQTEAFNDAFVKECAARGIHKLGAFHTDALTYDVAHLLAQCGSTAKVSGDGAHVAAERLAINAAMQATKSFDGLLGNGICFKGNEGQLPGYTIRIDHEKWSLFYAWPANSCA